ncbi:sigma-70 family RNA polymerase sigma factor [Streptomyces canus]|uniref:sigma-70 family RNA polymerase sigma factor n=1 Tax=Streptomyces canus TaxID=58343 RepID=UPI003826E37C
MVGASMECGLKERRVPDIVEEWLPRGETERDRRFAQCVLPEVETLPRLATTLTAGPGHAQELVRDTLLRAYGMCDQYDGRQPRTWLLTLMRQARTDRSRGRGPRSAEDAVAGPVRAPANASERPGESLMVGSAFDEAVDAALEALPVKNRQVVRLVDQDALSYAEAAGLLGLSEATVTSRLRRARRRIRARLGTAAGLVPGRGER